jgi:ketol-acid reductoisomerase
MLRSMQTTTRCRLYPRANMKERKEDLFGEVVWVMGGTQLCTGVS